MQSKHRLSRLELIENHQDFLSNDCPGFVLLFLADTLAIKYNLFENSIEDLIPAIRRWSMKQPFIGDHELEHLALFVNPHVSWDEESLMLAFKDSYAFTPQIPILGHRKFGRKTPDDPLNVDEFMAVQICVKYKIPVSRESTFENVQLLIAEWSTRLTPLRQSIFQKLCSMSRQKLLSFKSHLLTRDSETIDYSPEHITTDTEAVNKIARCYRIDASESKTPKLELELLERVTDANFLPIDSDWRRKYLINPRYYHIDSRYFPKYDNLYSQRIKSHLQYLSGVSTSSVYINPDNKYSELIIGIDPNIDPAFTKTTTFYHEDIPFDQTERVRKLISSSKYNLIFTRDELADHFKIHHNLTIPLKKKLEFPDRDIDMIIRNSTGHEVVRVIEEIRSHRLKIVNDATEFLRGLRLTDFPGRILRKLETLGFILRGWKTVFGMGVDPLVDLPLDSANYPLEYQDQVEILGYTYIIELLQDHMTNIILSQIPLMVIRERDGIDCVVPYGEKKTVKDCLSIMITDPNRADNNAACIRLNSNTILTTAYVFMKSSGVCEPIFNIEQLVYLPG